MTTKTFADFALENFRKDLEKKDFKAAYKRFFTGDKEPLWTTLKNEGRGIEAIAAIQELGKQAITQKDRAHVLYWTGLLWDNSVSDQEDSDRQEKALTLYKEAKIAAIPGSEGDIRTQVSIIANLRVRGRFEEITPYVDAYLGAARNHFAATGDPAPYLELIGQCAHYYQQRPKENDAERDADIKQVGALYEEQLRLLEKSTDVGGRVDALTNAAAFFTTHGDTARAGQLFEKAFVAFKDIPPSQDPDSKKIWLNLRCAQYLDKTGKTGEAFAMFAAADAAARAYNGGKGFKDAVDQTTAALKYFTVRYPDLAAQKGESTRS